VESALSDDVAWTRLLQEIATVLPNDVWLTAFTGQKSSGQAPVRGSAPSAGTTGVGSINVTGQGFDQSSAARWLLRVGDLQSLSGLWLSSSTRSGENGGTVTFSSTATLTPQAKSGNDRRDKYLGGGS